MQRVLEAEWLDSLAPHDARAQRSRADLRRVNSLMRNARHIARALPPRAMSIADLGTGDGNLMLRVARRLRRPGIEVTLVDRARCATPADFERVGWRARVASEDALEFLRRPGPRFDAIVCNLFLHHFEPAVLRQLLAAAAQRTAFLVACEPRRSRLALQACRLLGLLGCNDVTRHDAAVSVRAGFRDGELSASWPQQPGWQLAEGPARPFGHVFSARRHAAL